MEFVPVKIRVSEQEVNSTKGTLRDMLIDRGYTPIAAQLPGANRLSSERKIYALDEQPRRDAFETSARLNLTDTRSRPKPVADEAEDLRARVAAKADHIARETRAIFQQRLEKALGNGIFDAATNRLRMETQYKSALHERINWEQLETEALDELRSGQPMQTSANTTTAGAFGAKLDRMLTSSNAARAREAHERQHTLLQERITRSLNALKRSGNAPGTGSTVGGALASTPMADRRMSKYGSFKAAASDLAMASSALEASGARRLARQATAPAGLPRVAQH